MVSESNSVYEGGVEAATYWLYYVARLHNPRLHDLRLEFSNDSMQIFTFTFG